jgi:hypothetical protein
VTRNRPREWWEIVETGIIFSVLVTVFFLLMHLVPA